MKRSISGIILALIIGLIGVVLAIGGAWLAALGGSLYYLIAGLALLASAYFLFRGRLLGGWIYLGLFILSAIWGFAEARGNAWAMVPWLIAPLVLLIAVLLVMPTMSPAPNRWKFAGGGILAAMLFVAISFAALGNGASAIAALPAQSSPGMSDPSGLATGADWPTYGGTECGLALLTADPDRSGQCREASKAVGSPYRRHAGERRLSEALRHREHAAEGRQPALHLHRQEHHRRARRGDRQAGVAGRSRTFPTRGSRTRPRAAAWPITKSPARPRTACAPAGSSKGRSTRRLIAVDALTGRPCTDFNGTGQQDTKIGMGWVPPGSASINSAPTIVRGIIVVPHQILDGQCRCAPSGVIQGFDAENRQARLGVGHAAPRLDRLSAQGPDLGAGHAQFVDHQRRATRSSAWSMFRWAIRPTITSPPAGRRSRTSTAARSSRSTSTTGRPRWTFQTVKKDVWDYDIGSQPSLIDYRGTPALLVPSKQGDLYVLDRATGKPLAPIGTIKAPQGGVEPQRTVAHPDRVAVEHAAQAAAAGIRHVGHVADRPDDLPHPISARPIIAAISRRRGPTSSRFNIPGYNGGSDWGSVVDRSGARRHRRQLQRHAQLRAADPARAGRQAGHQAALRAAASRRSSSHQIDPQWGVPYAIKVNAGWRMPFTKLMCKRPPYGGIRAIDVATGKTLWDRPFGTARRNGPFNLPTLLPFTIGTPNNGGAVTTASGLVFIAAATDDLIRAIDLRTGKTVWSAALPAGGQATPIDLSARRPRISGDLRRRPSFHGDADGRQRHRLRACRANRLTIGNRRSGRAVWYRFGVMVVLGGDVDHGQQGREDDNQNRNWWRRQAIISLRRRPRLSYRCRAAQSADADRRHHAQRHPGALSLGRRSGAAQPRPLSLRSS